MVVLHYSHTDKTLSGRIMIILKILFLSLLLFTTFTTKDGFAKSDTTFSAIGDALAIGFPASATVISLLEEDPMDVAEFGVTLLCQEIFVKLMKGAMSETSLGRRPADRGKDSPSYGFISSHVSATTAGAIKLWELYPENAYVRSAAVVGVLIVGGQRIDGDHHTPLQTCLGVGTAFLFDWVSPIVSDWIREKAQSTLHLTPEQVENISFTASLPESGNGIMGMISYRF